MAKAIPSNARAEIAKGARYNVDENRKHRDVTREMNKNNDGMNRLRPEDYGRGSSKRTDRK